MPLALAAGLLGLPPWLVFVLSGLAIVPLAVWLGRATETLAARAGSGVGALLNATFGNATELIVALVALRAGLVEVVKASLAGSIIGNLLLVLGLSLVVGGLRRERQVFNRTAASASAGAMALAIIGLVLPAAFSLTAGAADRPDEGPLSLLVAALLIALYVLSLVFSLGTHAHLYVGDIESDDGPTWTVPRALVVLALSTVGLAIMSELLVGSLEGAVHQLGWSELFIGVIFVPIIGNAAEHATAVVAATKDKMDLSLGIALGSSTQVALLVAPLLVFASIPLGHPMNLIFPAIELVALAAGVAIAALITLDGESNWFEGAQLLTAYGVIAAVMFLVG